MAEMLGYFHFVKSFWIELGSIWTELCSFWIELFSFWFMCNHQINRVFLVDFWKFLIKVLIFWMQKCNFHPLFFFSIGISGSKHASKYCITSWESFKGQNSHSKAFTHYEVECNQTGKYWVFQIITHFDAMFYLISSILPYYLLGVADKLSLQEEGGRWSKKSKILST